MKFSFKSHEGRKGILFLTLLFLLACIAFTFVRTARAQTYFTNSTPSPGAYQYNQNFINTYNVQQTISRQQQAGVLAGTIPAATVAFFSITNSWPTNIYTVAPTVTASPSGGATASNFAVVVSETTSNFVLSVGLTNQNINWISVGH